MFTKWKLGGYALGVLQWAGDVARSIDPEAAFRVAAKVIEIERERRDQPGAMKLSELLQWFTANYPNAGAASVVIGYVKAIVDLLNAVGVFRKASA